MPIYVQREVLERISDVFNAEAIWQAPGLALFSRRPLLRDLLERSPREQRGRAATRCFSHVTLVLPQEDVDDDYHLTRGNRAKELVQTLTALHQRDFGDLLGSDQVRYEVAGAETLARGEIAVRFGHAVYLPAADERVLYNISASRDSAVWKPVCPIYPNQRLALIGGADGATGVAASGWPFGTDGAILVVNDGPDSQPVVQMRPKDAFDCRFDADNGYYVITARSGAAANGAAPRLLLKIARSLSAPAATGAGPITLRSAPGPEPRSDSRSGPAMPAVWQARTSATAAADNADAATAVPLPAGRNGENDPTYAPTPASRQRVSLVALALPRLSRYRETGTDALEIPFNRALDLSGTAAGGEPAISFIVNASDELYARTEAGRQRINAPARFAPVDARAIELRAAPPQMAERYCATLCLAQPLSAPVASGARFTFGRSSRALSALRVLDSPRFLQRSGGADGASPDRIGLSRNAFSFEAAPQGYKIGRLAPTQALYHLDERMDFVADIGAASADEPYLLPPGHHLVAGHYVLRFDA